MANTKKILVVLMMVAAAVLATGCSDSNPVNVDSAVDTAPPAMPVAVRASMDNSGAAVVSWAANTVDSDLAGYIVTRENNGSVMTLVSSPTLETTVQDPSPAGGINVYSVYAVDTSGNESPVQSSTLVIVDNHATGKYSH